MYSEFMDCMIAISTYYLLFLISRDLILTNFNNTITLSFFKRVNYLIISVLCVNLLSGLILIIAVCMQHYCVDLEE